MSSVVTREDATGVAPLRRPLASRPRAPRPPHRSLEHPLSRFGRLVTRFMRPLQHITPGTLFRETLRRSCDLRPIQIQLSRGGADLDGFRLALLSDLHVGFFFSETEFAELADKVSNWSPDLICLAGDLVDQDPRELDLLKTGLARLRAREAVVAVPGNHDYAAEPDLRVFRRTIEEAGIVPLWNKGMRLRRGTASLWVAGLDDLTAGNPDLEAALSGLDEDEPAVLVSHHPDLFFEASYAGVDLMLAGHTHGGQITWFGQPLLPGKHHTQLGYWRGRHQVDGAQLLVGRGVGVCVLPVRVAAAPEVLLVELKTNCRRGL